MRLYELASVIIVVGLIYATITADRAVEGGDLNGITKDKVVKVVKQDVAFVKGELAKVVPNNEIKYND